MTPSTDSLPSSPPSCGLLIASSAYLALLDGLVPDDGSWGLVSCGREEMVAHGRRAERVVFVLHHDGSAEAQQTLTAVLSLANAVLRSGTVRAIYVGGPGAPLACWGSPLLNPLPQQLEDLAAMLAEDFATEPGLAVRPPRTRPPAPLPAAT